MINSTVLTGRLTKDMELKYTTSGTAVASATLAVERSFTDGNGERGSDFINFVIWRKSAENMANMTAKGSLVGIEGRIQTRNYENQQGQKVFVTEVVAEKFSLLESKEQTEQRKQGNFMKPQGNTQGNFGGQGNFQGQQHQPQPQRQTRSKQPKQTGFSPDQMYGNNQSLDDQLPF